MSDYKELLNNYPELTPVQGYCALVNAAVCPDNTVAKLPQYCKSNNISGTSCISEFRLLQFGTTLLEANEPSLLGINDPAVLYQMMLPVVKEQYKDSQSIGGR